ncbi:hypothetical protein IIV22_095L [Invertebrate iridescent virus 22]|uniref:Uncharacterized protein n=1 Tax=Invertebrate iridescent virus 22 TaxID=345198 RepID=S6DCZ1_9VIRU|nr:hypothetical protein IIV22_095L [Invertebrate iridescent virus 22]CCV01772.1 hypothetical protein IIV22_095L [Invertebrate iridescent virus 22]
MASGINFKIYDPVTQLVATGGGGGLPLTGGTLTGNLIMASGTKIIQSTAPTDPDDLTNKAYVDNAFAGFLPLAGGTMSGQIVQPLAPVAANDVANKAYVDATIGAPNSIPGTSITNNSIDNTQLAPGAAADNVAAGPDGSILPSKIQGGLLPLSGGGPMTGAISQPIAPVAANDVTNKAYVDATIGAPNSIPGSSIVNNSITNNQIAAGTITNNEIANNTITGGNIALGTITGANIAPATVANSNIVPGPASTIKGTNSLSNVDDCTIGGGLSLSAGASPTLTLNPATIQKTGDSQFGVMNFDPLGDFKETSATSGIAKLKQPALGVATTNASFDISGNFVSAKAGAISGQIVPNDTEFPYDNLVFKMNSSSPRSLMVRTATPSPDPTPQGFIGYGQPYWENPGPSEFVTGKVILRYLNPTTFKYLSERVVDEPTGSTYVDPAWDASTADPNAGTGSVEIYAFYLNDGVENGGFRVTCIHFDTDSFICVERLF